MSAIRATLIMMVMLFTMIVIVTGLNANSSSDSILTTDGYGISAHFNSP